MKINHIILGSDDVPTATEFYQKYLGFISTDENPGMKGGKVLEGKGTHLLLLPFKKEKLPNPFHFAFEADNREEFLAIYEQLVVDGLEPREWPARDSRRQIGKLTRGEEAFEIFYFFDPSGINLEVMLRV